MPVEALIDALVRETEQRVVAIDADVVARVDALRAEADRAATDARRARQAEITAGAASRAEAEVGAAEQETRRIRLEARARLLERVRVAAHARLAHADGSVGWQAHVPALIAAARRAGAAATVRCRPTAADAVRDAAPDLVVVADLDRAGLVFEGPGVRVDATLETWLDRAFPRLARAVLADLP